MSELCSFLWYDTALQAVAATIVLVTFNAILDTLIQLHSYKYIPLPGLNQAGCRLGVCATLTYTPIICTYFKLKLCHIYNKGILLRVHVEYMYSFAE